MQPEVQQRLTALNQQFYQTFALQFSATRQRIQPGVRRIAAGIPQDARLLDLGCGNGALIRYLLEGGFQGVYVGVDFSPCLLEEARKEIPPDRQIAFLPEDLSQPGWEAGLRAQLPGLDVPPFDTALAFAVLHHLPGVETRLALLEAIHRLLEPGGRLVLSNWQFLNSPRLAARVIPWERAGLSVEQVDPGDYLLDWKSGGYALRYVHLFTSEELESLAQASRFRVEESFLSDGENHRLGLYQVWSANSAV